MPFQNVGTDIIKAYLAGDAQRRQELALKHKIEQDTENAAEQKRQFNEQLAQQQKQFNAEHALRKALNEIDITTKKSNLIKNSLDTNLPIPDSTETVAPTTTSQQDFEQLNQNTTGMGPNQVRDNTTGPRLQRTATLQDGTQLQLPDFLSHQQDMAQRERMLLQPQTEAHVAQAKGIAEATSPFKLAAIQAQFEGKQLIEAAKYKEQLDILGKKDAFNKENIRLRANLRPTPGANAKSKEDNAYLSVTDAQKLGLPYGYTKGEVAKMGLQPQREFTATEEAKKNGLLLLRKQLQDVYDLGQASDWSLHGAIAPELSANVKGRLNMLTDAQAKYRSALGKLTAGQLHDTYGSVLSAAELAKAKSWVTDLTQGSKTAKANIQQGLNDTSFMLDQILNPAGVHQQGVRINPNSTKAIKKTFFKDGKAINTVSHDGGVTFEEED